MFRLRVCVVCGKSYIIGHEYTCSDECHKKLVDELVARFGEYKRVIDAETGKAYKVPTRDIAERGLDWKDLIKYPEWAEKQK